MTRQEKLRLISEQISDIFDMDTLIGKQAVLSQIIMHMDVDEAKKFIDDTLSMMDEEIDYCFDAMDLCEYEPTLEDAQEDRYNTEKGN